MKLSEIPGDATPPSNETAAPKHKLSDFVPPEPKQPVREQPRGFPYDTPGREYGEVLPFSTDKKGDVSLDVPEMVRAPLRGMKEYWERSKTSFAPTSSDVNPKVPTQDMLAAAMAGGMRPAPGQMSVEGARLFKATEPETVSTAVKQAADAGYVLPPAMSGKQGPISSMLSGWAGKVKLQQHASLKNQEITNELAGKSIGVPKGTPLSEEVLGGIREKAGEVYDKVAKSKSLMLQDDAFKGVVEKIGGQDSEATKYFPGIMKNPEVKAMVEELKGVQYFSPRAGLEVVKQLRFASNGNLKSPGDPMKHALGLAQREAANAVDDLMERNLVGSTDEGLMAKLRQARQTIARSYDIEGAMNPATGDVSAIGLGRLYTRGRPFTGELKTIAETANTFPRAVQNVNRFGGNEPHSVLDFFGSAFAVAHGHLGVAAAIAGRPIVRGALLAKPVQQRLMSPARPQSPVPRNADALTRMTPGLVAGEDDEFNDAVRKTGIGSFSPGR